MENEQDTKDSNNKDLATLWEEMGASTGSFLGKVIGITAQNGLEAYEQNVIKPMTRAKERIGEPPASDTDVSPDIRQQTWQEMGKEYGESVGKSIGMSMDLMINSFKNTAESGIPNSNRQIPPKDHNHCDHHDQ